MVGGGSNTIDLDNALGQTGRQEIKNYISNGGNFYGICMGAYYAGSIFYNIKDNSITYPGLGLYPGTPGTMGGTTAGRLEVVNWTMDKVTKAYNLFYQDGPNFYLDTIPTGVTVETVAKYQSDGSIAALIATYGKGKVFVTGPHPEANSDWFDVAVPSEMGIPAYGPLCPKGTDCSNLQLAVWALNKVTQSSGFRLLPSLYLLVTSLLFLLVN